MITVKKDMLVIKRFPTRKEMGNAVAAEAAAHIRGLLKEQQGLRVIFAAAPSQNEFLEALAGDKSIDFRRISAFHMDEYVGLPADAPQGFGNFLKHRIFALCHFRDVNYLNGLAPDIEAECTRYAALLNSAPIDIVFMGIGENAHIAFNDPGAADFKDSKTVKVVELDAVCRRQQVNDGCFARLDDVPFRALTLTIPALLHAKQIFCVVPAKTKAEAVYNSLSGEITERYPASILRSHGNAVMYLDRDSGARLEEIQDLEKPENQGA
jgi:glucosamine-6-phosphate deaminase